MIRRVTVYDVHWVLLAVVILMVNRVSIQMAQVDLASGLFIVLHLGCRLAQVSVRSLLLLLCCYGGCFCYDFTSGLGVYVRLITAEVVNAVLSSCGIENMSASYVLITENQVSTIDAPCSGLKSLAVGTALFCGAVLLYRVAMSVRVVVLYLGFVLALFLSNVLRILSLVLLMHVWQMREVADALHMPLGLLLFLLNIAGVAFLLQRCDRSVARRQQEGRAPGWYILAVCLLLGAVPMIPTASHERWFDHAMVNWPEGWNAMAMSTRERAYYAKKSETKMVKRGRAGASLVLVETSEVNGVHPPEVCLTAHGYEILHVDEREQCVMMELSGGQYAAYWLQHRDEISTDFIEVAAAQLFGQRRQWVLCSLLITGSEQEARELIENFTQNKKLIDLTKDGDYRYE